MDLLSKAEPSDRGAIALDIFLAQVCQQSATATDKLEKTSPGVMVVLVLTKVARQAVDPLSQKGNLDFR